MYGFYGYYGGTLSKMACDSLKKQMDAYASKWKRNKADHTKYKNKMAHNKRMMAKYQQAGLITKFKKASDNYRKHKRKKEQAWNNYQANLKKAQGLSMRWSGQCASGQYAASNVASTPTLHAPITTSTLIPTPVTVTPPGVALTAPASTSAAPFVPSATVEAAAASTDSAIDAIDETWQEKLMNQAKDPKVLALVALLGFVGYQQFVKKRKK